MDSNSQNTLLKVCLSSSFSFSLSLFFWSPNLWLFNKTKAECILLPFPSFQMFPHMEKSFNCYFFFACFRTGCLINSKWETISKENAFAKGWLLLCLVTNPPVFYLSVLFVSAFLGNWLTCSSSQGTRKHTAEQFYFVLHFYVHLRVNPITAVGNSITAIYDK